MTKIFLYIKTEPFVDGLEYFVLSSARGLSGLYNWAQTAQRIEYRYQILPRVLRSRKSLGIPGREFRGGGNPYDSQTPSERGISFRRQVYEKLGFHYSKHKKGYGNLSFLSVKGLWRLKSKEN